MRTLLRSCALLVALAAFAACDDNKLTDDGGGGPADMSMSGHTDGSGPAPDLAFVCSNMPMTHAEIINACTTAQTYDNMPFYPTLAPNGVLPPTN